VFVLSFLPPPFFFFPNLFIIIIVVDLRVTKVTNHCAAGWGLGVGGGREEGGGLGFLRECHVPVGSAVCGDRGRVGVGGGCITSCAPGQFGGCNDGASERL
jgi:hypothetical protein